MNTTKEKIKTILICLLLVGMVYLMYAVWFYDSPFGRLRLDSIFEIYVQEEVGSGAGSDTERFGIRPLAISVRDIKGMRGGVYDSNVSDKIYEFLRGDISNAFKRSKEIDLAIYADWEKALVSDGVFMDYKSDIPVSSVRMWLGATPDNGTVCGRYYILDASSKNVKIYIKNSKNEIYKAETEMSSETLKTAISQVEGTSLAFAFEKEEEDFRSVLPETLLGATEHEKEELSAYNSGVSFAAETAQSCLEVFGLRDVTPTKYSEQDGTEVYIADMVTLKLSTDGIAIYTDLRDMADEILGIRIESDGGMPTLSEKTEGARKLVASLASKLLGDGGIYIASVSENQERTEIVFGRHVGGIPVDMKGTVYFASVVIKGESVRSAKINLGGYNKTGKKIQIIPERLVVAAISGSGNSGDMNLRYADTGNATVSPSWYIGGIKKKNE